MEADVRPTDTDPSKPQALPAATEEAVFHALSTYPFSQDADFQEGLSSILSNQPAPATPEEEAQRDETVLQAQCFYYSRCATHIEFQEKECKANLETCVASSTSQSTLAHTRPTSNFERESPPPIPFHHTQYMRALNININNNNTHPTKYAHYPLYLPTSHRLHPTQPPSPPSSTS